MNSVVSLDHFALSFLFCRQVNISLLHSDTPGNPARLEVFSIYTCRTKKLGVVKNIGRNKHVFNMKFCFNYACGNESKKNITKITRMFLKIEMFSSIGALVVD